MPSNRHVIQQALQLRKPSSQISTCEWAVWPAEEVATQRKIPIGEIDTPVNQI